MYHEEHSLLNGHFANFYAFLYFTEKHNFNNSRAVYCIFVTLLNLCVSKKQKKTHNRRLVLFTTRGFRAMGSRLLCVFWYLIRQKQTWTSVPCKTAPDVCWSAGSTKNLPSDLLSCRSISVPCRNRIPLLYTWPRTNFVAALSTGNTGEGVGSPCSSYSALVISQLMSSPCYLSLQIHGSGTGCCCRCHILICSPLWKTLASINFTFMVCTHNKWVWGVVVYQKSLLLSNLNKLEQNHVWTMTCLGGKKLLLIFEYTLSIIPDISVIQLFFYFLCRVFVLFDSFFSPLDDEKQHKLFYTEM